jgi:hypothetical protein
MHATNLRSPLAVGLLAAVAAGAIALPPTTGHLGLPGLRVVSDANISLANCGSWGKGFAEWCASNPDGSYDPATLTITGPNNNSLVVTVYKPTETIAFTGPWGTTYGPYPLPAFIAAETLFSDLRQFSPGQRLENLQAIEEKLQAIEVKLTALQESLESAIEARVAAAKETLEKVAAAGLAVVVAAFFVVEQVLAALGYFNVAEVSPAVASDSAAPADSLDGISPAAQEKGWLATASAAEVPSAEVGADVASAVPADVSAAKAPAVEANPEATAVAEAAPEVTRAAEDAEAPAVETVEATVATEIATLAMDAAEVEKDSDVAQPAPSSPSRRAPRAVKRSNSATVESATRPPATASPAAVADAAPAKPAANRRAS